MSARRTHWQHPDQETLSWCGIPAGERITSNEDAVTCKPCRALLDDAADWRTHTYGVAVPVPESELDASTRRIVETLRREEGKARPWESWRGAVRAYVGWQDDGASLRSSSHPGRFETLPSGYSGPPQGDQGQQQAERLCRVGEAIEGAFPAGFVVHTSPVLMVLAPDQSRAILLAIVCGRDTDTRTGGQGRWRKQRFRGRIPIADETCDCSGVSPMVEKCGKCGRRGHDRRRTPHAIVAAEVTLRAGFHVTAGDVAALEREGGKSIQRFLDARGLVLRLDKSLDEWREAEDMAEKITDAWDLKGWDEIANHLDVDESTAKRWEKTEGLPVERYAGTVRAKSADLAEWLPRFLASRKTA